MKNKGFTLIESIVVMAIIGTLAVFGVINIIEFQRNAILSSSAAELVSALRQAQNKSIAGELPLGVKDELPDNFTTTGWPQYRVNFSGTSFKIIGDYELVSGGGVVVHEEVSNTNLNSNIAITSVPAVTDITFTRVTGLNNPASVVITVKRNDNPNRKIEISVSDNGVITLNKSL